jgi:hypothetical protein
VDDAGLSINAAWVIVSALNFLLLIGLIVLFARFVRWILATRRHDAEISSLQLRVTRLEADRVPGTAEEHATVEPPRPSAG